MAGLDWSLACRRPALQSRGLETLAKWETDQLRERGLSDEGIVDELLAIEIEMWSNAQAEQKR